MSVTPRFALPLISPGQAQKELFHNEALQLLDVLVAAVVEGPSLAAPPETPEIGDCYIVGEQPEGEWAGHAQHLAAYTIGGWRFVKPCDGLSALLRNSGATAVYRDRSWEIGSLRGSQLIIGGSKVVGSRGGAIQEPAGGRAADLEARAAIGEILAALREHGLIEV